MNHHRLAGARLRTEEHTDPVVLAMLLFPQAGVLFRIEKVRMGIERAQHARDRALIDSLVSREFVRVIIADDVIDLRE